MARGYPVAPCDLLREHIELNPASFSQSLASDTWNYEAYVDGTPARSAHTHDTTAYPAPPAMVVDSWLSRQRGWGTSPANNSTPANNTQGVTT